MRNIESIIEYLKNNNISDSDINQNLDRIVNLNNSLHPNLKDDLAYSKILKYIKYPNIFDKIQNLAGSIFSHVSNSFENVNSDIKLQRLSICNSCEFLDKDSKSCNVCGCFVEVKTSWASEKCPIDKWVSEISSENQSVSQPIPASGDCGCNKK